MPVSAVCVYPANNSVEDSTGRFGRNGGVFDIFRTLLVNPNTGTQTTSGYVEVSSLNRYRIVSVKMDLTSFFFIISNSLIFEMSEMSSSPLHIASYTLRIGVSVIELYASEYLISHTFQRKHYTSIVRTGNVIMYA